MRAAFGNVKLRNIPGARIGILIKFVGNTCIYLVPVGCHVIAERNVVVCLLHDLCQRWMPRIPAVATVQFAERSVPNFIPALQSGLINSLQPQSGYIHSN